MIFPTYLDQLQIFRNLIDGGMFISVGQRKLPENVHLVPHIVRAA